MSWLRLDDGFTKHPKFEGWSTSQKWAWLEVMEYCARYQTDGRVPDDLSILPRSTTKTLLKLAENAGWCGRKEDGSLWINDWAVYNPTRDAARMQETRAALPSLRGNEWEQTRAQVFSRDAGICSDCGKDCKTPKDGRDLWNADHEPPRDQLEAAGISVYDIAYIFTRCHSCHAKKTRRQASERRANTEANTQTEHKANPRTRASARVPVPSRPSSYSSSVVNGADDETAMKLTELSRDGTDDAVRWIAAYRQDPDRVTRCIAAAQRDATTNVGGYLDTLIRNGSRPDVDTRQPSDRVYASCLNWVESPGFDRTMDDDAVLEEFGRRERKLNGSLHLEQRLQLLDLAEQRRSDPDPEPLPENGDAPDPDAAVRARALIAKVGLDGPSTHAEPAREPLDLSDKYDWKTTLAQIPEEDTAA